MSERRSKLSGVDREAAAAINPLIGALWTEDTLENLSGVVTDLGSLASIAARTEPSGAESLTRLWLLFDTVSAALDYEAENIRSAKLSRKEKIRMAG